MIDWRQLNSEPLLDGGIVVLAWAYGLMAGPFRARWAPSEPWPRIRALRFYSGLAFLYLAVGSPFTRIGRLDLFCAHVLLQMAIMYPAAGLVLSGLPPWMIDAVATRGGIRRAMAVLTRPLAAGGLFTLVAGIWYLPKPLEWALSRESGHALEAGSVFVASLFFWWPLLSPSRAFPPLRYGGRIVYLFVIEVAMTAVFSYILMAEHPMYPTYELAPRLIGGLGAQEDQSLGGILLSGVSSLVLVGALGVNFLRWARHSETPSPRS